MSGTSKARLQPIKDSLDTLFAGAHSADKPELIKELRDYLSLKASAAKQPGYNKNGSVTAG